MTDDSEVRILERKRRTKAEEGTLASVKGALRPICKRRFAFKEVCVQEG